MQIWRSEYNDCSVLSIARFGWPSTSLGVQRAEYHVPWAVFLEQSEDSGVTVNKSTWKLLSSRLIPLDLQNTPMSFP